MSLRNRSWVAAPWRLAWIAAAIGLVASSSCVRSEPRAQTVIWIDTDLAVPTFADTLRIELLDEHGASTELRQHTLPNRDDWPTSFGVTAGSNGAPVRFRLRLFPAKRVVASYRGDSVDPDAGARPPRDDRTIDPAYAVDRIIEIRPATHGIERVGIVLSGYCLGIVSNVETGRTCVSLGDEEHTDGKALPVDGITQLDADPKTSLLGTWSLAAQRPCSGDPMPDSGVQDEEVCVPGGWFLFGDQKLTRVSPFFLDRYEVTLGRWKRAVARGFVPPPRALDDGYSVCTTRASGAKSEDALNCVTWTGARAFCEHEGRELPSEVQWELAASGRGWQREYVWGDEEPSCDRAVYGRSPGVRAPGTSSECYQAGMPQHPWKGGTADLSRDGIADLAGNVAEWTLDETDDFPSGQCWAGSRFVDPVCKRFGGPLVGLALPKRIQHTVRGGAYSDQAFWVWVGRRFGLADDMLGQGTTWSPKVGFRCARKGTP